MRAITIRTSAPHWFKTLAIAYKKKTPTLIIDDARAGIDPSLENLFSMGIKAGLTPPEWVGVAVSLGVGSVGMWMIRIAIADPEPTSKLGALIIGGVICVIGGGSYAAYILTNKRPPTVRASKLGFELSWD